MAAYLIAHIEVTDPEAFKDYGAAVPAVVERFGGRYLVRGGAVEALEGDWTIPRLVIIAFADMAVAQRFYDSADYQEILPLRLAATKGTVALVEGV